MTASGGRDLIIATLIAADRLTRDSLRDAAAALDHSGLTVDDRRWLDEGSAADLEIRGQAAELARARASLEGRLPGVDVIVQPAQGREKKLLVADMDSTMIGQECIDELADYAGCKPQVAEITERAMRGELDFTAALRERVALLEGLASETLDRCRVERVRVSPGARTLVRTMRARGAGTLLVSGGFTAFAEPIAEEIGFEQVRANRLASSGGRLAGTVDGAIVDSAVKRDALIELRDRLGLQPEAVLAIGDGANDRPMIEEAGLGIAYRAKPVLAEVADARLDHNRLDALLWAQGIRRCDWVTD